MVIVKERLSFGEKSWYNGETGKGDLFVPARCRRKHGVPVQSGTMKGGAEMRGTMKRKIINRCLAICLITALCVTGLQTAPQRAAAAGKPSVSVSKRTKTTATIKIKKMKKVTGYQVYFATSRHGRYRQIGSTLSGEFQITKIKQNKAYYVKVRTYKTSGIRITTGKFSSVVKIGKYSPESVADQYAREVLELVNKERTKAGLAELKMSSALNDVAAVRAKELTEEFSHTRPNGRDCFTALTDAGIQYSSVGENIAAGQATPQKVVTSWMNSEGHRANILSEDYTHMGIGYYHTSKGYQYYWAQIFIKGE